MIGCPDRPPARLGRHRRLSGIGRLAVPLAVCAALACGCSGEEAIPIDPANPPVSVDLTDVTHGLEPTEQMRDAAEQQCLDDPDLIEGYVRAVDPDTGAMLAELSVGCDEVRRGG